MKRTLILSATILACAGAAGGLFFLERASVSKPYDVQLTVAPVPQPIPSQAEAQAKIHVLRLQYFGSDEHPEMPPSAAELAFYRAAVDTEIIELRREQTSQEYELEWGQFRDREPSDPVLKRAKKASHDRAMAAQADSIKALTKQMEAMQALAAEWGAENSPAR